MSTIKEIGISIGYLTGEIHRLMRGLEEEEAYDSLSEAVEERVTKIASLALRLEYKRWSAPLWDADEEEEAATPLATKKRRMATIRRKAVSSTPEGPLPQWSAPLWGDVGPRPVTPRAPKRKSETRLTPPALAKRGRDGFVDVGREVLIHGVDTPYSPSTAYIVISSEEEAEEEGDDVDTSMRVADEWCDDMISDVSSASSATMDEADGEWAVTPLSHFVSTLVILFSKILSVTNYTHLSSEETCLITNLLTM